MTTSLKPDKILSPGDCHIESIVLSSYNEFQIDVIQHMAELVINESMDYSCLSGYLHIVDNLNLMRNVPLIGNEKLTVVFSTPSRPQKIKKTFFCYKIDARTESPNNKGSSLYRLHFVSEEFMTSLKKKISVSFKDKKYSEMVQDIFNGNLSSSKILTVQKTLDNKNLVVPYMSPFQAINMIALRCISNDNRSKSYMFYEDLDGFCFCDVNFFAQKNKSKVEYTWFKPNISEDRDASVLKDIEKEFYRIETYDIETTHNTIDNLSDGLYSSLLLLHDSTYKTVSAISFSYNNDFQQLNTMQKNGILPIKNDIFSAYNLAHYRFYPRQSYAHDGIEINDTYDKVVLHRNAYISQLNNSRLSIVVAGDSQRRVGEKVKVNIPSLQPSYKSEEDFDPYLSGDYIITKITHMISPVYYKMRLQLERDSLPIAYPEEKTVEFKS